jgi:myo-inositol-1(or 4)-monophosphatase
MPAAMLEYAREIESARRAACEAAARISAHAVPERAPVSAEKAPDHPVTHADLEANAAIEDELRRAFPKDYLLSEESADDPARHAAERVWIVDPLDGTKEFIARIPEYAVSIALVVAGEPRVGVVYSPPDRECFWAVAGAGAYLDDRRLTISACARLADSTLLSSRTEMRRGQVEVVRPRVRELRPVGSAALKLAWVAAGRGDVWLSMAPKSEWDVAAGDLLVREAGGVFVTGRGRPPTYNQRDVALAPPMAAGPPVLVDALRALALTP